MFKNLEENDMNIILDAMHKKVYEASDEVIKQGDDGDELYVVSKGKLTCSRTNSDGEDKFLKEY